MKHLRIGSTLALTIASIKMYYRNFSAIFFTFIFPVIFLLVFGYINKGGSLQLNVAYFNQSETELAQVYDQALKSNFINPGGSKNDNQGKIFKEDSSSKTVDSAKEKLANGELNAIIIVPENFGVADNKIPQGQVMVITDAQDRDFANLIVTITQAPLEEMNRQVNKQILGAEPLQVFSIKNETIQGESLDAISYLVPGIIGFSIMSLGIFSITGGFIELKTNGSLRRLKVSPISPFNFLVAESITRLLMTVVNVATMLILAFILFDFNLQGSIIEFMLFAILGIIVFLGMGFAIAGWAKNADQAAPISNIIFFPMMFLSGSFFPRELFPEWIKPVSDLLPLTFVSDGLREIANNGASILDLGTELLGMGVWAVIVYFIAVKLFRWE